MEKGPPVWVSDQHGLTLPEGDTHVQQLWFMSDGQERSAKLAGALEGEERQVRTSPRLPAPLASSLAAYPAPFRPPTPPPSGPIARADTSVSSQKMWDEHKMLFQALVDAEAGKADATPAPAPDPS